MKPLDIPFNVELLQLGDREAALMRPVTSMDVVETAGGDLADNGLFSVSIFGRVGEEIRDRRFSYIDIHTTILHPVIYKRLERTKQLYAEIMSGKAHAVWDNELKDFTRSNELEGKTGYQFFMEHWPHIVFKRNQSAIRNLNIDLFDKYRGKSTVNKILVLPAGLRDVETDDNGRLRIGEINEFYRKILAVSATIAHTHDSSTSPVLNTARFMLQTAFNNVFDYVENMLEGKKGFLQGKWGSRRIFNGTQNVITAMNTSVKELGGKNSPRFTDTVMGLHQLTRSLLPVAIHALRTGYLSQIFNLGDTTALLVDEKTLKSEIVKLPHEIFDRYTTVDGLEKLIASYGQVETRHLPIVIEGRYLALIYIDNQANFKVFHDIDDLPEGYDRKFVKPLNLCELIYLSGYKIWNDYVGFVSRYPITGIGSCYPSTVYVKTTINGEVRHELDDNWQRYSEDHIAVEFPVFKPLTYLDSQVIPSARIAGLGAD